MTPTRWLSFTLLAALACVAALAFPSERASGKRHGRATVGMDCAVCHTPAGWQVRPELGSANGFNHDLTGFPLRGGHKRAACTQCHDGRREVERTCVSCHVDDHQGKLGKSCDRCHNANTFKNVDAFTIHSRTRLPLTGMHAVVDCNDCHRRMSSESFSSTPSQCFACHEDDYNRTDVHPVHNGSQGNPPFSRNCAECHRTTAFYPAVVDANRFLSAQNGALSSFDMRAHDRKFVLSRGPHRGAPCASCHSDLREPRMTRCTGCHNHDRPTLAKQHPRMPVPTDGSCLACHAGGFAR